MMKLTRRYFLQGIGASAVLGTLTGLAPTKALAMNSYGANTSLLAKRAGTTNTAAASETAQTDA